MKNDFLESDYLNAIDKTIINNTKYPVKNFTGGYVSSTVAYKNKIIKYKVCLFFGYKADKKTSISHIFEIEEELYYFWNQAILTKVKSLQSATIGSNISDFRKLISDLTEEEKEEKEKRNIKMSEDENVRTDTARNTARHTPPTSYLLPTTSLPPTSALKNILTLKEYYKHNNISENGKYKIIEWGKYKMKIDNKGIPFHSDNLVKLNFEASDKFYTDLLDFFKNKKLHEAC